MKYDTIIINGIVATASDAGKYSIAIKDGKIASLAAKFPLEDLEGAQIIDAEGAFVTPGGIDAHVHISQDLNTGPDASAGGRCADNFETGSRSAVAGGTTTMISFATQERSQKSFLDVVKDYNDKAESTGSYIDYSYHLIITRADKDVVEQELPVVIGDWGISSVKLFMTYEAMRLRDGELLDVMLEAKKNKITTMIHAENGDLIDWLTVKGKLEEKGWTEPYYHGHARIPIVEGEATNRAIVLSELVQNPILFVHVSASSATEVIRKAQSRGLPIYAETCPQYLHLTWEDLKQFHSPTCFENSKLICSPPPGPDDSDQEFLWTGLRNGTFTIYSSDHCPFRYDDPRGKMLGILDHEESMKGHDKSCQINHLTEFAKDKKGHFAYIPNGCPGIETRLPLLFNYGVLTGRIPIEKFVELTATNPAKLYGLYPKKGAFVPGVSDADITIWYPEGRIEPFKLTNDHLHHDVDYTPYEGFEFQNWPRYTLLRGKVMWKEGSLVGKPRDGNYIKRGPSFFRDRTQHSKKDPRRVAQWLL